MPIRHRVRPGECMSSIAFRYGFAPETVWNRPENDALRVLRKNPNVLFGGDEVFVPDRVARRVTASVDRVHRFERRAVPESFQLQLLDADGRGRASLPYTFEVDGRRLEGRTDADGWVRQPIPPDASSALLIVHGPEEDEELSIELGHLDPVSEPTGAQARLRQLGFDCPDTGRWDEGTSIALRLFQLSRELPAHGEHDEDTLRLLEDAYGS
jgi:hypothetical protein